MGIATLLDSDSKINNLIQATSDKNKQTSVNKAETYKNFINVYKNQIKNNQTTKVAYNPAANHDAISQKFTEFIEGTEKNEGLKQKNSYSYDMCMNDVQRMEKLGMDTDNWKNALTSMPKGWEGVQNQFISITDQILSSGNLSNSSKASMIDGMTNSVNNILSMDISEFDKLQKITAVFWTVKKAIDSCDMDDEAMKMFDESQKGRSEDTKEKNTAQNWEPAKLALDENKPAALNNDEVNIKNYQKISSQSQRKKD